MQIDHIPLGQLSVAAINMRRGRKAPDVSDILPSIALTEMKVKRILALGNLLPRIREAYRSEAIDAATTRFCIDPLLHRRERRLARNQLMTSLVVHARREGIRTYSAVANLAWAEQIMRFGWNCRELGPGMRCGGEELVALQISIDDDTLPALRQSGIYADATYVAAAEPGVVS